MVIPRISGWVFPILPEDWLEISERNSELLGAELTVNIQLVFMAGLCRCYFFSKLLKKGELFSAWWNMIDICHHPCHALCFTALQERQKRQILQRKQVETLSLNSTKVSCPAGTSWAALPGISVQLEIFFFKQKRCNLKPYNKFWPELGICSVLLCSWGTEVANFS